MTVSPFLARVMVCAIYAIIPASYIIVSASLLLVITGGASHSFRYDNWLNLTLTRVVVSLAYAEVAFSLYHTYLVRQSQRRLPPYQHDPAFLRSVMLRALGTDMAPVFPPPSQCTSPSLSPASPLLNVLHTKQGADSINMSSTTATMTRHPSRPISPSGFAPLHAPLSYQDPRAVQFRQRQMLWFGGGDWSLLRRDNMREWLAWVLYGVELHDPILTTSPTQHAFLHQCLVWIEHRAGVAMIPEGFNPQLSRATIRLTLDPVRVKARPLLLYAITACATAVTKRILLHQRFTIQTYSGVDFLVRVPPQWTADDATQDALLRPLVFIHGLGIGLTQYATTLHYFATAPLAQGRPVLFPLQPSISTEFFHPGHLLHPSQDSMTQALVQAVSTLGWTGCGLDVVGHSNGSIVAAWMVKSVPHLVKRLCLIDPVCFCLWEADVAYNFLYSTPKTGIEILMRYFIGCELGVALSLQRHFNWASNILFPSDVPGFSDPSRFVVFLAGQDGILNAPRIRRYLIENGMQDADSTIMVGGVGGDGDDNEQEGQGEREQWRTREGDGKGKGGLVVAWDGVHGQSLMTGSSQFARVIRWLEGHGLS